MQNVLVEGRVVRGLHWQMIPTWLPRWQWPQASDKVAGGVAEAVDVAAAEAVLRMRMSQQMSQWRLRSQWRLMGQRSLRSQQSQMRH